MNLVQTYVTRLRRLLRSGPLAVESVPGGYLLRAGPGTLDVLEFRSTVAAARQEASAGTRCRLLERALALWQGEPAAGIDALAQDPAVTALQRERLAVAIEFAAAAVAAGEVARTVGPLAELAQRHPLHEPLHLRWIAAQALVGDQAGALRAYERLRAGLAEELGIDPGPELRAMHEQILRQQLAAPATAPAAPASAEEPTQLPGDLGALAGRAAELARLDAILDRPGTTAAAIADTAGVGVTNTARAGKTAIPEQSSATAAAITSTARAGKPATPEQSGTARAGKPAILERSSTTAVAITGTAGVGKTALAVHWARRVRDRFPGGQLYVDLRGRAGGPPLEPATVLRGFLEALGVTDVPSTTQALAGLYRGLLADRRVLVVLDNAADADQVRPLLPGSPGSLALITSRDQVTSLVAGGAYPLSLGVLSTVDATALLAARLGADRTAAEPAATREIVTRCARLPLALALVAARAAVRPGFSLAAVAAGLPEPGAALGAWSDSETAAELRAAFAPSYHALSDGAAALFGQLPCAVGESLSVPAAASLAAVTPPTARALLAELARAHLVAERAPGRYALEHELLTGYARELADPARRRAARVRLLDHYLQSAATAALLLDPHRDPLPTPAAAPGVVAEEFADAAAALAWFTAEAAVLAAAVGAAAAGGQHAHAWQLAWHAGVHLRRTGNWAGLRAVHDLGLAAARRAADPVALAYSLRGLAAAATGAGHPGEAVALLDQALAHAADPLALARIHAELAAAHAAPDDPARDPARALRHADQAVRLHRGAGNRAGAAAALSLQARLHGEQGDPARAIALGTEALTALHDLADRPNEARAHLHLAETYRRAGNPARAGTHYRRAADLANALADHPLAAETQP